MLPETFDGLDSVGNVPPLLQPFDTNAVFAVSEKHPIVSAVFVHIAPQSFVNERDFL